MSVQAFQVSIPKADLEDLQERLPRTRWPDELPGGMEPRRAIGTPQGARPSTGRTDTIGASGDEAQRVSAVHHYHRRPKHPLPARPLPEPGALPLIISHGYPSSVVEFLSIIGPLTDPRAHGGDPADAFHVVAPSLPGWVLRSGAANGLGHAAYYQGMGRADAASAMSATVPMVATSAPASRGCWPASNPSTSSVRM